MFCFSNCPHSSSDTLEVSSVTAIETASTNKVTQLVVTSPTGSKTSMVLTTTFHLKKKNQHYLVSIELAVKSPPHLEKKKRTHFLTE